MSGFKVKKLTVYGKTVKGDDKLLELKYDIDSAIEHDNIIYVLFCISDSVPSYIIQILLLLIQCSPI